LAGSLTEAYNPLGTTALMRAAELGSRHLARILEAGADPLATDSTGRSAIFYAAKTGQVGEETREKQLENECFIKQ
jgi:ankyrin repeat protein